MAVLSDPDAPPAVIGDRLQSLGISGCFTSIISSVELGQTKPSPFGYLTAIRRLDLPPEQTAFVGHDTDELRGARRCGMRTIAFNYDREASADCRIGRFNDLVALLGRRDGGEAPLWKAA